MRLVVPVLFLLVASGCGTVPHADQPQPVRGIVYHDANGNGVRDDGEKGLASMRVSNGREIALTDAAGTYSLPIGDDAIIFVIKPRGWMTPVNEVNLPRFFYIHKPAGSPRLKYPGVEPTGPLPESIDFPLVKREEPDSFRIIVFGDTQTETLQQVGYLAHDVVEEVIGFQEGAGADSAAVFGLLLGDIVDNELELMGPVNEVIAQIGLPFYGVIGNHDTNQDVSADTLSDEAFESIYGPVYYSFDYGPVHFLVLDTIYWTGKADDWPEPWRPGLGERQLQFIRNDLALVEDDRLVVLAMHVPIVQIRDEERAALYRNLAKHSRVVSFSAHTHIQEHAFLEGEDGWPTADSHHHINFGAVCGYWWYGATDELGIPHATMADGTPNGWSLITFDDNAYSVRFKAARRPADYQMNVYAPEEIAASEAADTEVLVNVFAGSSRSLVKMRIDKGPWIDMRQKANRLDPAAEALDQVGGDCPHLWQAHLPAGPTPGTHTIEVTTTDMFGQTYAGRRIIRVK
ncbi:MAG: calcineurin-like phosphoesterase family protein [Verrucomicrobia bacterium]|nr:calcineurin-like phosphoesterase family protein [Verrucomicrobiota bacterium]